MIPTAGRLAMQRKWSVTTAEATTDTLRSFRSLRAMSRSPTNWSESTVYTFTMHASAVLRTYGEESATACLEREVEVVDVDVE